MTHDDRENLKAIGIALAGATLGASFLRYPPSGSAEVAAWVQGIGTVVAVVVAGWVGLIPVRREAAAKQEIRRETCKAIEAALEFMQKLLATLDKGIEENDYVVAARGFRSVQFGRMQELLNDLLQIPPVEWPSHSLRIRVHNLGSIFAVATAEIPNVPMTKKNLTQQQEQQAWTLMKSTADTIRSQFGKIRKEMSA